MARRAPPAAAGVVTWGWYSVTEGAAQTSGGSVPGLIPRDRTAHAFWAAWWTEDPRLRPDADPDAFGFYYGPKAAFFAGAEAESCIRRTKSPRAFVVSIADSYARAAYREGAPRQRSEATDFEEIAAAWCDERGIPRTAHEAMIKDAWRGYLKAEHPDHGGGSVDLEAEKKRYEAALAGARARESGQRRAQQREAVAAGRLPEDVVKKNRDRATIASAKKIAGAVRARVEVIARCLGAREDLAGLCHFAALGLVEALRADGLQAVMASSCGHSWAHVLLEGGPDPMLLDVTATQYKLAPVYVRLPGQRRRYPYDLLKVKGAASRAGAQGAADRVVERAPARWWAIEPWQLPNALRAAGTTLTELGAQAIGGRAARAAAHGPSTEYAAAQEGP